MFGVFSGIFVLYLQADGTDRDWFRRIGRRGIMTRRRVEGLRRYLLPALGSQPYTPDQMEERAETRQLVNVFPSPGGASKQKKIDEKLEIETRTADDRTGWNQKNFKVAWASYYQI